MNSESKNAILYERQFRVIRTIIGKGTISNCPITDWQPESNIDDAMTWFRNKMDNNEFCFYSYEERYVQAKEDWIKSIEEKLANCPEEYLVTSDDLNLAFKKLQKKKKIRKD